MPFDGIHKLGKKPATAPRNPKRLRHYLLAMPTPPVPASIAWTGHVPVWPMLDNDTIGNCTIAAVGHAVQCWTSVTGKARVMTDTEALTGYERFGYVPGDESTDNGANAQDVLTSWISSGFGCGGVDDKLTAFCPIAAGDAQETKEGVAWLGVVYAGIALPLGVQGADSWDCGPLEPNGAPADGPWAFGSWGGHAVPIVGYAERGLIVVTWGKLLWMTWAFWRTYGDEAYGLLSRDFASAAIPAEAWDTLEADMQQLRASASVAA